MQAERTPSRAQRRADVLWCVNDEASATAGQVAYQLNYPDSTVRRDLEWLEREGFVEGFKHDERNFADGRIRVYYSATDKGKAFLADETQDGALEGIQNPHGKVENDGR